jgi:hypothetical protein
MGSKKPPLNHQKLKACAWTKRLEERGREVACSFFKVRSTLQHSPRDERLRSVGLPHDYREKVEGPN